MGPNNHVRAEERGVNLLTQNKAEVKVRIVEKMKKLNLETILPRGTNDKATSNQYPNCC